MFTKKVITMISAITAVLGLIAGIWAFDGHYITKSEAKEKIAVTEEKFDVKLDSFETLVAGSLQRQEVKSDYKFYQFMYDKLTQDMANIKRMLRRDPENQELRQDYVDVKEQRQEVKEKLEQLMKEID